MSENLLKTCRKCSLALIFMLFLQSTQAQNDFTQLNAILKKNEKTFGKEYVVVVNKEGKNIFLKESEEFKLKIPAPIGNSSKWLTVALVMIFVDEKKINLDDQVSKYLPIFEKYMKGFIQCVIYFLNKSVAIPYGFLEETIFVNFSSPFL